jgi:hypothetical protein
VDQSQTYKSDAQFCRVPEVEEDAVMCRGFFSEQVICGPSDEEEERKPGRVESKGRRGVRDGANDEGSRAEYRTRGWVGHETRPGFFEV